MAKGPQVFSGVTSSPANALSALSPFRQKVFRSLWIAAVISYTGTWMQIVGTGWLMTSLTRSPMMVGLVQAATSLPVFLVALPAGALADMVDRRRLLLVTQGWMVLAATTLGLLTITGLVTPWILLLFTFLLGLGAVMNDPAWQAIVPEFIPGDELISGLALNSVGFNVARAVGPALGGLVIWVAGSGSAFLLNAASFFGVIFFLYRWKPIPAEHVASRGDIMTSIMAGLNYARSSRAAQSLLVRTGVFSFSASALWALLPLVARPHGSVGFGLLLGFFGLGALSGAGALPRLRRLLSTDVLVAIATLWFALVTFMLGQVQAFSVLCGVTFLGGVGWITILVCLNFAAQTMSPRWVRARALSMYLLVFQGGMAAGSALWGALAGRIGIANVLLCAGIGLVIGLAAIPRYPLNSSTVAGEPLLS